MILHLLDNVVSGGANSLLGRFKVLTSIQIDEQAIGIQAIAADTKAILIEIVITFGTTATIANPASPM